MERRLHSATGRSYTWRALKTNRWKPNRELPRPDNPNDQSRNSRDAPAHFSARAPVPPLRELFCAAAPWSATYEITLLQNVFKIGRNKLANCSVRNVLLMNISFNCTNWTLWLTKNDVWRWCYLSILFLELFKWLTNLYVLFVNSKLTSTTKQQSSLHCSIMDTELY